MGRLMLSRKQSEKIVLSSDGEIIATFTVTKARGPVKISIDAPPHIKADRLETFEAKRESHPEYKPDAMPDPNLAARIQADNQRDFAKFRETMKDCFQPRNE